MFIAILCRYKFFKPARGKMMNFMKQKLSLSAAHTNSLSAKVLRLIENAQEKTRFAAHGKNFDLQILFAYNVSPLHDPLFEKSAP